VGDSVTSGTLTKELALLVEGKDEESFFEAFFSHLSIRDIQMRPYEGKDRLSAFLKAFILDPGYGKLRAFGIVRDADLSQDSAFESIARALENAGLHHPKRSGEFANKGGKKIGIFILPGSGNSGMLEDLCLSTVRSHPVTPPLNNYFSALETVLTKRIPPNAQMQAGKNYFPKNEAKARAQAFLAGMHETVNNVGLGAKHGDLLPKNRSTGYESL
jgi:hypothetical protein